MSNAQSILSIGALLFLSLISLRFNSSALENATVEVENKVYLTAFSLADDLIEEIKQKAASKQQTVSETWQDRLMIEDDDDEACLICTL